MGQRAKSFVAQAKRRAGVGDAPLVTEAGGRAEGMSEAFRAFGEGDIDRFLDAFADDVQWSAPSGENFPGGGEHEGRDAIREVFVEDAKRSYASFGFRPERYLESPGENVVVAFGAFVGEPAQGTRQLDEPAVQMWEFDGDKVVFVGIYTDSAGFPGVVTEEEEAEREEKAEQKDEQAEQKDSKEDAEEGSDSV
ncbi:MAG: nuclear transport factor 2 family protein [Solirubrobacteraceae bacterium]